MFHHKITCINYFQQMLGEALKKNAKKFHVLLVLYKVVCLSLGKLVCRYRCIFPPKIENSTICIYLFLAILFVYVRISAVCHKIPL